MEKIKLYCWECEKWVICKTPPNPRSDLYAFRISGKQQGRPSKYPDIRWFERLRLCPEEHEVHTFEIDARFVNELIRLRELVEQLAPTVNTIAKESKRLAKNSKAHKRNKQPPKRQ